MSDRFDSEVRLLKKIADAVEQQTAVLPVLPPGEEIQTTGNLSTDPEFTEESDILYPSQLAVKTYVGFRVEGHSTLAYAATTNIDFLLEPYRTLTLAGNVTFTSSNRVAAVSVTVRIIAGGSSRNLAFPAGWIFVGAAAPASLAANKEAILTITAFGSVESDVRAAYSAQP